jgi:hypothetical protein
VSLPKGIKVENKELLSLSRVIVVTATAVVRRDKDENRNIAKGPQEMTN